MPITKEQLKSIMLLCDVALWTDPLNAAMSKFEINTPSRMAAFLAQIAHESTETTRLVEGLSYSRPERILQIFKGRFASIESAKPYVKNPQGLANFVYANRGGNGDTASDEGYRYRGRGLFQLTTKDNYRIAGAALKLDLVANPDLVRTPKVAALTAGHFWYSRGLNVLADHQPGDNDELDFEKISIRINGGRVGLVERKKYWAKAKTVLGVA